MFAKIGPTFDAMYAAAEGVVAKQATTPSSPPAAGSTGMDKGMGTGASSKGGQSTHATGAGTMSAAGSQLDKAALPEIS